MGAFAASADRVIDALGGSRNCYANVSMSESIKPPQSSGLRRWSQRKHEAAREKAGERLEEKSADRLAEKFSAPSAAETPLPPAAAARTAPAAAPAHDDPLPPVESLTIDSDFSPFLRPKVDAMLKRQALKQLFRDPHFNVMDGLDIYIGDYSQPDPIAPEIVRQMVQSRYIFDPPPTRINAQGFVEDIPAEELATLEADASAAADALPEPDAEAAGIPTLPASPEAAAVASTPSASEPAVEPGVEPPPAEASEKIHPKPQ